MSETRVCRACLRPAIKGDYVEIEHNSVLNDFKEVVSFCLPTYGIKVTNICFCHPCISMTFLYHDFKKMCSKTDDRLKAYLAGKPQLDVVDLKDVLAGQKSVVGTSILTSLSIDVTKEPSLASVRLDLVGSKDVVNVPSTSTKEPSLEPSEEPEKIISSNLKCHLCAGGVSFSNKEQLIEHLVEIHSTNK